MVLVEDSFLFCANGIDALRPKITDDRLFDDSLAFDGVLKWKANKRIGIYELLKVGTTPIETKALGKNCVEQLFGDVVMFGMIFGRKRIAIREQPVTFIAIGEFTLVVRDAFDGAASEHIYCDVVGNQMPDESDAQLMARIVEFVGDHC